LNRTKIPLWVWAAILVPALISLFGIYRRNHVEARNRSVTIATEIETIESLATAQGLSVDQAIRQLQQRGLNGVVLGEETVNDLLSRGEATINTSYVPNTGGAPGAVVTSLQFSDPRSIERVQRGLRIRFGEQSTNLAVRQNRLLLPPVPVNLIRNVTIGLNPNDTKLARRLGVVQIARHGNPTGISASAVRETLAWSKELGTKVYLPQGDQVLGRRKALSATVDALKQLDLLYASIEFGKIGGDANMLQAIPERIVRLHSAQAAELDRLPDIDAVERYGKAARERNMRILLVRPISNASDAPLDTFGDFVGSIADHVRNEGNVIGAPHGYLDSALPRPYFILLGLSFVPAAVFALRSFVSNSRLVLAGTVLLALLGLACAVKPGQELMALVASLTFPVVAFIALEALKPKHPALGFFLVSAISLVGGLGVAGMLNGLPYFIGADQPLGTKLGLFLPIPLIGLYFILRLADLKEIMKNPITWGAAALSLAVAMGLALLVARSGNDTGAGASGLEIVFRNLLDRFLYVRPRTKEFMIGHPALVVGIGLLLTIAKRPELRAKLGGWTALALMLGAVGQTGIVNTLWHLHIPVTLSLARIGIGAVLGCMIGLGLWAIVSRFIPKGEAGA
jgi:hypothetical protein